MKTYIVRGQDVGARRRWRKDLKSDYLWFDQPRLFLVFPKSGTAGESGQYTIPMRRSFRLKTKGQESSHGVVVAAHPGGIIVPPSRTDAQLPRSATLAVAEIHFGTGLDEVRRDVR